MAKNKNKIRSSQTTTRQKRVDTPNENKRYERLLTEISPDGLYYIDTFGKFLFVNRAFAKMYGYSIEETLNFKNWSQLVPAKTIKQAQKNFKKLIRGWAVQDEIICRHKDGHEFPVDFIAAPVKRGGKVIGFTGVIRDITKSKKAEEKLYNSEEKFRNLFEHASDGIFIIDSQSHRFLDANDAAVKQLGYTRRELLKLTISDIDTPLADRRNVSIINKLQRTGSVVFERTHRRKDGSEFPVEISSRPIKYGNKQVFQRFARDISERKQVEETLRENEERYRDLYENAPLCYFSVGMDGRIRMVNNGAVELLGYTRDDLIGRSVIDLYADTPAGKEKARPLNQRIQAGEEVHGEEMEMRKADGGSVWISLTVRIVRDAQGKPLGRRGIVVDISKRKQAEEKLKTYAKDLENAKLKDEAILSSIGEGIVATDKDGKIIIFNQQAEKILGLEAKKVINKKLVEVRKIVDENNNEVPVEKQPIQQVLSFGKRVSTSSYYFLINKTKIPVSITATPVLIGTKTLGSIVVFRDISKEREAERAKSEFVSMVSHQLHTPLTSINLFAEALLNRQVGNLNKEQNEYIDNIYSSSKKLTQLVNNLLSVARIGSEGLKTRSKETQLENIIEDVIDEAKQDPRHKKTPVVLNKPKERLPKILVDSTVIHQTINNLLTNAVQYSVGKNPKVTVTLTSNNKKEYLISIKDNGIGIPKNAQPKIFDKLFRAENALRTLPEGFGLGLYLSKMSIEAMGGKIWFESREGKGTTFYLYLTIPMKKKPRNNKNE